MKRYHQDYDKTIVVVGATSTIAEACMEIWGSSGYRFILVGRSKERTKKLESRLELATSDAVISSFICNFKDPEDIKLTVSEICSLYRFHIVMIAHGTYSAAVSDNTDPADARNQIEVNVLSSVLFAEHFLSREYTRQPRHIVLFGSVAGDRPRSYNYVYSSTKCFLDCYSKGLNLKIKPFGDLITLVKPGPTRTPMLRENAKYLIPTSPQRVARDIVNGINLKKRVIYSPWYWHLIMSFLKLIPEPIFAKIFKSM